MVVLDGPTGSTDLPTGHPASCSVIDLLDRFQSCALDFGPYLEMLPPMRARQYSISCSPLWDPDRDDLRRLRHCAVRGFLHDRAAQKAAGRETGPAALFFGTNHPDVDFLYRDELVQ